MTIDERIAALAETLGTTIGVLAKRLSDAELGGDGTGLSISLLNEKVSKAGDAMTGSLSFSGAGSIDPGAGSLSISVPDTGASTGLTIGAGAITCTASSGTGTSSLVQTAAGSLSFSGEEIERVSASGGIANDTTNTSGYVRYASGLLICYGRCIDTQSPATITLPSAYIDGSSYLIFDYMDNKVAATFTSKTATSFVVRAQVNNFHSWLTIGRWKN